MKLRTTFAQLYAPFYRASAKRNPPLQILWSKGYGLLCDFRGDEDYWLAGTEVCQSGAFFREHYSDAHGLVWVRLGSRAKVGESCDLDRFVESALPSIRRPFALITTDGDTSVPSELRPETVASLLDCPWLVSWHTQNYDGTPHARLAPLPIGLDLHSPRPLTTPRSLATRLEGIAADRVPAAQMPPGVLCDLGVSLASESRRQAIAALSDCEHVDFTNKRIPLAAIWKRYASYPLVLSTEGHGLDTHRTWELLYLGCIVITGKSSLTPLYEGLPVVVVDDWREVRDKANLERWQEAFGPLTDREKVWSRLRPNAWLDPIRERLASAPS